MHFARRTISCAAALLFCAPPPPPALAITRDDVSFTKLLPKDTTLYKYDAAPLQQASFDCLNVKGASRISLSDFTKAGKYVVLWMYPEDTLGIEAANNEQEALSFQKLLQDGKALPAIGGALTALTLLEPERVKVLKGAGSNHYISQAPAATALASRTWMRSSWAALRSRLT